MSAPDRRDCRPEDPATVALLMRDYAVACALSSAITFCIERAERDHDESLAGASPTYLRIGLDEVMTDTAAPAQLLVDKGVISEREYLEALVVGAEQELDRITAEVRDATGDPNLSFR